MKVIKRSREKILAAPDGKIKHNKSDDKGKEQVCATTTERIKQIVVVRNFKAKKQTIEKAVQREKLSDLLFPPDLDDKIIRECVST